ncbi:hypothetical protein OUZ56_004889 [Daphnia magna]|uniref:Uncharacterized protein n=1 Tax=Daphnia magna TaxID=35525 RepID=A0ABQ9YR59_9CRUS|nr:hypothetical protein OUZ56_004889 [Daphnia magna]
MVGQEVLNDGTLEVSLVSLMKNAVGNKSYFSEDLVTLLPQPIPTDRQGLHSSLEKKQNTAGLKLKDY